jgi:hypothetical protein
MNKFSALGLSALVTVAGSAQAGALIDSCTRQQAFGIPTSIACTTGNGATSGNGIGSNPPTTVDANLFHGTNAGDKTTAQGLNSSGITVCAALDRNPSVGSDVLASGCSAAVQLFLSVQNRF